MFRKITSAVSSITGSPGPLPPSHHAHARTEAYAEFAKTLSTFGVPVSDADCAACDAPCDDKTGGAGTVAEFGNAWDGKTYEQYVMDKYGDLGELPDAVDTDWDSDLMGSGGPPRGRVVVISTGKSDWVRDHVDEADSLSYQINRYMSTLSGGGKGGKGGKGGFLSGPPPPSSYVLDSAFPPPSKELDAPVTQPPSLYSSSLVSQSDDPEDQMAILFPDWKVVLEVENSPAGAKGIWEGALAGDLGRAGRPLQANGEGIERRRSYVLPYRAIVLLCSHKRRDKRCHIAAGLLRSALHTCLAAHDISVDENGASLSHLDGPLEEISGTSAEREAEVGAKIAAIEGAKGGDGGEVGIFNINHLGGHRYAGVMLILFPSGAYLSYGRVTPKEIPRVVEETILQGKVVPGLLRSGTALTRTGGSNECGFLGW